MNCPRCVQRRGAGGGVYRGNPQPVDLVRLEDEEHPAGGTIHRCRSCRGAFVEHETLHALVSGTRSRIGETTSAEMLQRAHQLPTPPIACPSCGGEAVKREWGIGTLVFVDVCVECRGVWLDPGELETLGG